MAKRITIEVEYTVEEVENEYDPTLGTAEWLEKALREYLTDPEYPLRDDYSLGGWGGYDGPYITDARIIRSEVT